MSFITMKMAETFPEGDILEELDTLEEQTIAGFAGLVYTAYRRGCRRQIIRCMARYMYHEGKSYEETRKIFDCPLIQNQDLRKAVCEYLVMYAAMQDKGDGL